MRKLSHLLLPLGTIAANVGLVVTLNALAAYTHPDLFIPVYWLSLLGVGSGGVVFFFSSYSREIQFPSKSLYKIWLSGLPWMGSALLFLFLTAQVTLLSSEATLIFGYIFLLLFSVGIFFPLLQLLRQKQEVFKGNCLGESLPSDMTAEDYLNRRVLLTKVEDYWGKGILDNSLSTQVKQRLNLQETFQGKRLPWPMEWEDKNSAKKTLSSATALLHEILGKEANGEVILIVGKSGLGKTTTLLELSRELVSMAQEDPKFSIPVVLNLSSWRGGEETIADWVVKELKQSYQIPAELGEDWLETDEFLLLLDGLDEMNSALRETFLTAIANFQDSHTITTVLTTCQVPAQDNLSVTGTLYLSPLTNEQVEAYLAQTGSHLAGLKVARSQDEKLHRLSQVPLMLNLMSLAYSEMSATDILCPNGEEFFSIEKQEESVFKQYCEKQFQAFEGKRRYSEEQAKHWLSWLAKKLSQQSHSVFFIEQMRYEEAKESWLEDWKEQKLYTLGIWLAATLMTSPIIGLASGILGGIILGSVRSPLGIPVIRGLYQPLARGMMGLLNRPVGNLMFTQIQKPVNRLVWVSLRGPIRRSALRFLNKPTWKLLLRMISKNLSKKVFRRSPKFIQRFVENQRVSRLMLSLGMTPKTTNRKLVESAEKAVGWGILGALFALIIGGIFDVHVLEAKFAGLLCGLFGGGFFFIEHFIVRLILFLSGKIPWKYEQFLDEATELGFLQKVGSGYIFFHQKLQDYFAQLSEIDSASNSIYREKQLQLKNDASIYLKGYADYKH